MKKLLSALIFTLISGWTFAEPLKTTFNPFTGKPDYITKIDTNTIIPGTSITITCTNGACTVNSTAGGGGASSLGVTQNGTQITSPTVALNMLGPPFVVLAAGSTAQFTLDFTSVTAQGNNFPNQGVLFGTGSGFTNNSSNFVWDNSNDVLMVGPAGSTPNTASFMTINGAAYNSGGSQLNSLSALSINDKGKVIGAGTNGLDNVSFGIQNSTTVVSWGIVTAPISSNFSAAPVALNTPMQPMKWQNSSTMAGPIDTIEWNLQGRRLTLGTSAPSPGTAQDNYYVVIDSNTGDSVYLGVQSTWTVVGSTSSNNLKIQTGGVTAMEIDTGRSVSVPFGINVSTFIVNQTNTGAISAVTVTAAGTGNAIAVTENAEGGGAVQVDNGGAVNISQFVAGDALVIMSSYTSAQTGTSDLLILDRNINRNDPIIRVFKNANNSAPEMRWDSPAPNMEMVSISTDNTVGRGKWEPFATPSASEILQVNSRSWDNTTFETVAYWEPLDIQPSQNKPGLFLKAQTLANDSDVLASSNTSGVNFFTQNNHTIGITGPLNVASGSWRWRLPHTLVNTGQVLYEAPADSFSDYPLEFTTGGSSGQFLTNGGTGAPYWSTAAAGGGGGSFTMVMTTGSPGGFSQPPLSSSTVTSTLIASSNSFTSQILGSTTFYLDLANNIKTRSMGVTWDGGGSVLTAGTTYWLVVPATGTIKEMVITASPSGSVTVNISSAAFFGDPQALICAAACPSLTSSASTFDNTLSGWTTAVAKDSFLFFVVNTATTITQLNVTLEYQTP